MPFPSPSLSCDPKFSPSGGALGNRDAFKSHRSLSISMGRTNDLSGFLRSALIWGGNRERNRFLIHHTGIGRRNPHSRVLILGNRESSRTAEPSFLPSFLRSALNWNGGENGPNSVHSYRRNSSCGLYLLGRCIVERKDRNCIRSRPRKGRVGAWKSDTIYCTDMSKMVKDRLRDSVL